MKINRQLVLLALILIPLVSYNFMSAAWTTPTSGTKAATNTAAPIDVSGASQVKLGALATGPLAVTGNLSATGNISSLQFSSWGQMNILANNHIYLGAQNGHNVYVSRHWGGAGNLVAEGSLFSAGPIYVQGYCFKPVTVYLDKIDGDWFNLSRGDQPVILDGIPWIHGSVVVLAQC